MAFTRDWDPANPTDDNYAYEMDDYNRYLREDVADRLKTMFYGFIAGENTYEAHCKALNLREQGSASQPSANYGKVYCKEVSGVAELFWQDESGNEKQLTTGGKLNVEALEAVLLSGDQTVAGTKTFSAAAAFLLGLTVGQDTDIGNYALRAKAFHADIPDGTAPLTIDSSTKVANLNADAVDGCHVGGMFGSWTTLDTASNALVAGAVYQAQTDGIVVAQSTDDPTFVLSGYLGNSNPPTTLIAKTESEGLSDEPGFIILPVAKDEYVKVSIANGSLASYRWRPVGTGGLVKQA